MKITTKAEKIDTPGAVFYPWVAQSASSGLVVLFGKHKHGVVVHAGTSAYDFGHYSDDWDMSAFRTFRGKISITCEE